MAGKIAKTKLARGIDFDFGEVKTDKLMGTKAINILSDSHSNFGWSKHNGQLTHSTSYPLVMSVNFPGKEVS